MAFLVGAGGAPGLKADRVGLYVKPDTRDRLKLFQSTECIRQGKVLSQSECIEILLDREGVPTLAQIVNEAR